MNTDKIKFTHYKTKLCVSEKTRQIILLTPPSANKCMMIWSIWYMIIIYNIHRLCDRLWTYKTRGTLPSFLLFHFMSKGRVKKKKIREFSLRGGGPSDFGSVSLFFLSFLNMVWIIQKCKEIFFSPFGRVGGRVGTPTFGGRYP